MDMKLPSSDCISLDVISDGTKMSAVLLNKINEKGLEDKDDAFFVANIGDITGKHRTWLKNLPRVTPYYAVKCNDDPMVLQVLAALGTGFDCASKNEIQKILDLKVPASRIVYANPCKQVSHIRFAAKHNVETITFDNETELHKIKTVYPTAKLVIRIIPPDDTKSQCQLSMKFGCHPTEARRLLSVAMELGLDVIGVSFHVGSGCYDASAYSDAVTSARAVFDIGAQIGYRFTLLDIGGGFPGEKDPKLSFEEICAVINPTLDKLFPEEMGVDIIAEPGRFFVASAFTLVVNVIAKRAIPRDNPGKGQAVTGDDQPCFMYYVNDGVYGSFNCLLYDHASVIPTLLEDRCRDETMYPSSIWGPTCDGLDCILDTCSLPELYPGDWIVFNDMGAYTMCAASGFNGMPKPKCYYAITDGDRDSICHANCKIGTQVDRPVCSPRFTHSLKKGASEQFRDILQMMERPVLHDVLSIGPEF